MTPFSLLSKSNHRPSLPTPLFRPSLLMVAWVLNLLIATVMTAKGVDDLHLPDPLTMVDGTRVETAAAWRDVRRDEILELFRTHVYGRAPVARPSSLHFKVIRFDPAAMDGAATLKVVRISASGPGGAHAFNLIVYTPNRHPGRAPGFLFICNRSPQHIDPDREGFSEFWPADQLVARGYATAAFYYSDVVRDRRNSFDTGYFSVFDETPRKDDAWGAVAAWAWGASRALDYLETDAAVDADRVAIVGHSRGGKAALWAGAEDERFALVVSNDSGSTGAAIARGKTGERVADIVKNFPYWFCSNYQRFAGREDTLPVDQHLLAALIAPRLLYIASASEDGWSDPSHEYLAGVEASPVYELLGQPGLVGPTGSASPPESPQHDGRIGYHLRQGKHDLTAFDWSLFMDFADRHPGFRQTHP